MKRAPLAAPIAPDSEGAADPHMPTVTSVPARTSYHHGNLRDALVMRGIEILDTQGFDALSLRQAARDVVSRRRRHCTTSMARSATWRPLRHKAFA